MKKPRIIFLFIALVSFGQCIVSAQIRNQGAIGSVTIDGKVWNQIAMRPVIPFGKWALSLDLVVYFDAEGNIRSDGWDFSSASASKNSIIDKIYFIRYGFPNDLFYVKFGALERVDLGYGVLVNGYSNSILYPQERKIGLQFNVASESHELHAFANDLKENMGIIGGRLSTKNFFNLPIGISFIADRNQYLGLRDNDKDGRPNIVDDFPNNDRWWLDSDGDGLSDSDPNEWDVDGDGITDTLDARIPGYNGDLMVLDDDIIRKDEPINIDKNPDGLMAVAIDLGFPIIRSDKLNITIYAQAAKMLGKTQDPDTGDEEPLGIGLIPFGVSSWFGPLHFIFEYRSIPEGKFEFSYWNRLYEIERVSFLRNNSNQVVLRTKESQLGKFGDQNGYFSRVSLDVGAFFEANMAYNNMVGSLWSNDDKKFILEKNQTFLTSLKLTKSISRIQSASAFYQQRNVPNPFKFKYTESTIIGCRLGISMGQGLVLNYIFRRTFRDYNANGRIDGNAETIDITSIETSFTF